MAENVSVWHHATLRADTAALVIGKDSNVQDNVCIHAGDGYPVTLGEQVTIGHSAVIHGRTLELAQLLSFSPTWFSHSLTGLPMPFG